MRILVKVALLCGMIFLVTGCAHGHYRHHGYYYSQARYIDAPASYGRVYSYGYTYPVYKKHYYYYVPYDAKRYYYGHHQHRAKLAHRPYDYMSR